MIRCPKCGTLNRDNSRFCNECGAPLQRTQIRCPNCGAMNPVGNVFCDKCHARLIPTTGLKPLPAAPSSVESTMSGLKSISLPTRSAEAAPEGGELPDWLLELSDTAAAESEETPEEGALPDWLAGLGGGATPPPEAAAPEELPDWLSGMEGETNAPPAAPAAPPAESALPDWLSGLAEPDTGAAPAALADWLSEQVETPTGPESAAESAQPDWLQDLMATEPSPPERKPARSPALPLTEPDAAAALPDWLGDFGLTEPAAETAAEEEAAAPPDWLAGMVSEPDAAAEDEAAAPPDWLAGMVSEPDAAAEDEAAASPDWLTGMVSEPAAAAEDEAAAPPDWLTGMVSEPAAAGEASPAELTAEEEEDVLELDWTRGIAAEEPAVAEAPAAPPLGFAGFAEDGEPEIVGSDEVAMAPARPLPDWLLAIVDPNAPPPAGPAEMPAWLLQNADRGAAPSAGVAPLPDWLLLNAEAAPVKPAPPKLLPSRVAPAAPLAAEPPDWASDIVSEAAPEAEEAPAAPAAELPDWISGIVSEAEPEAAAPAAELPDWISGIVSEAGAEAAPAAPSTGPTAPVELPDWLAEIAGEAEEEASLTPEPAEGLPDWLAERAPEVEAVAELALFAETPAPAGGEPETAALPDWLAGIVAEAEADEEIPDWLSAVEEPEAAPRPADIFEPAPVEPESALPDWLGGQEAEAAPPAAAGFATAPEAAEMPDWLKAVEPAASEPPARHAPQEVPLPAEEAMPDWLASIAEEAEAEAPAAPALLPGAQEPDASALPEEAAALPSGGTPGWLAGLTASSEEGVPETPTMPAGDDLARANVPVWLQELRPTGTGPLPGLPPEIAGILDAGASAAGGAAAGLAQAEIPEWVQQLRPTVTGAGEVISEKYMGPAETTGPLAGLAGLIVPLPGVDIAPDFAPTPLPQPPEVIVQQAQLWQQLLQQPRGKARPVAQQGGRPGLGAALLRIAVALLLLAAAALGLLWEGENLGQSPEPAARPGLGLLKNSIAGLQPGDVVILAVEYGPAEALEMQPIAETLLDQLAAQQVKVIAVSTLPEGPGLIQGLLASRAITNYLPSTESVYRVGADSGIADLLTRGEVWEADMVLVVAARLAPLRGWIEQNVAARRPLPLGVGANAATGAYVTAYYETRGLNGWLVGFADLTAYRQMLYQGDFAQMGALELPRVLNALLLTHWVAAGFLLFGLLYAVTAGKKGAR